MTTKTPAKNKRGRPTTLAVSEIGFQDPGPRAKMLIQKHGAASILRAVRDEKFLADNFTAYDGMIIIGIANSLKGSGEERERMFNRMFGKVPDKSINLNLNIEASPDQLSKRASDMLDRITIDNDDIEIE